MRPAIRSFVGFCLLVAAACAGAPPPSPVGAQPLDLTIRSEPLPLKLDEPGLRKIGKLIHAEGVEQIGGKIWIPYPHPIFYIDRTGEWHHAKPHGAGKTLIWQRGQVTMRLEGDLTKEKALEISAS